MAPHYSREGFISSSMYSESGVLTLWGVTISLQDLGPRMLFLTNVIAQRLRVGSHIKAPSVVLPRSELVLLLFDAHKLDISDEFRDIISGLKGLENRVRCVLNKADQVNNERLVRVYGALMRVLPASSALSSAAIDVQERDEPK